MFHKCSGFEFFFHFQAEVMPKVQSRRKRVGKAEPFETMMVDEAVPVETQVEVEEAEVAGESNHAVHKRQAGEWKRMKGQVAQLKKQRKKQSMQR